MKRYERSLSYINLAMTFPFVSCISLREVVVAFSHESLESFGLGGPDTEQEDQVEDEDYHKLVLMEPPLPPHST